ncbi:MAG: efflux RND transporter periplasmic adaptor subunit [Pseudomonadota bacterium]
MNLQTNNPTPATALRADAAEHVVRPAAASMDDPGVPAASDGRWIVTAIVQFGLVAGLAVAAYLAFHTIIASAPTADRNPRERVARLVNVAPAVAAEHGPVIRAWGTVRAAQVLIVRPEIAGRIDWVHPDVAPGGLLPAGTEVARLDDRDLRLAVLRVEADIADIEARILIEEGQAAIGERELTRLSRNITEAQKALVRREPQMAQLDAELAAARASLEQAQNALARTSVISPFDALVLSERVAPGTMLTVGMEAATLAQADMFEVVLHVPARNLDWIALDGTQVVELSQPGVWPDGATREGRVVRLGAGLSETGRMVELIVALPDPLTRDPGNQGKPRVLLGSYLQGQITGLPVDVGDTGSAVEVDRAHLRDGDTIWVMNAEDKLEIRALDIAWRGPEAVLATNGLAPGERIVTTRLATFAPGMALRTDSTE